jgi:hypothetical protein
MAMIPPVVRSATLLIASGLSALAVPAQDPPPAPEQANVEAALALTRECATRYEIVADAASRPCELEARPLLRWSNPERGQIYGNVFLWTFRGRPVVVGSLFKWYSPFTHMSHEFQSLSADPFVARYDGAEVWRTTERGLTYANLPEAPSVADTAAGRLIQMRQLARRFSAREVTRESEKIELRLLPQPLHRYAETGEQAETVDGGLFVFVQGTDPEIWLLLEAQRSGQSAAQWKFALARMNSVTLFVDYDGREVWRREVLPWEAIKSHKGPYTSFQFNHPSP